MLTVNSTINLAGQAVPNIIPAVQGDTGRVIVFTLADFTIPAGSTATYYVQKPSGEAVYNAATINNNKVTVGLTAQSLAETGDNYGQVRILNGEDVVTSFDFILLVKPFRGIGAIESTTEMNIFDEAVQNAMEQFDSMLPDIIAPEFDSSTAYAAGDYVIYGGKLYQFTASHSGAWTGADASSVVMGNELSSLKEELEHISGIFDDVKDALLQIASKVTYVDEHGQDYYDALYEALYPPADLVSISAVYTQSGTVYDTDTLDSLKADLVVTALYDDQTTETVTSYTLSGTLTAGTSTITVSYGGKTTTFTVTVTAEPVNPFDGVHWNDGVRVLGKDEYTGHSNYTTTDYVDISAINSITVTNTMTGNMQYAINWYSSNVNSSYISNETGYLNDTSATSNKPENAQYARICATKLGGGYPYATGAIEITVG